MLAAHIGRDRPRRRRLKICLWLTLNHESIFLGRSCFFRAARGGVGPAPGAARARERYGGRDLLFSEVFSSGGRGQVSQLSWSFLGVGACEFWGVRVLGLAASTPVWVQVWACTPAALHTYAITLTLIF